MVVRRRPKPLLIIIILIAIILLGVGFTCSYLSSPVDKNNNKDIEVEIVSGSGTSQISNILKENNLIRDKNLFKVYVKFYNIKSLKAGTYVFNKSMDLKEIIDLLEKGSSYNPNKVVLTFREGLRITDYATVISENTNNSYDDVVKVMTDTSYINELIGDYWFLTDEILNSSIYYPLEGYLAPDTYHFDNRDVDIKTIIKTMLDEMDNKLSDYKSIISQDVHYYMTMASIVELEGTNTENRKMIVSVFKNRLKSGMNLGSDVTTYYGLQVEMTRDLTTDEFASVN
jgi:UPF0755 protein